LNIMGNQEEGGVTWLAVQDWVDLIQVEGVWQPVDGLADHPVTGVSWYGARAYCTWRQARLPTEAEWEKAGRGMLQGKLYPWGDEPPVCYIMTPNGAQFGDCEGDTAPVGSFGSNGYGLHDMAGNAWEWVNDWYAEGQAYYAQSPPTDPDGPASGTAHILRGGAWDAAPEALQVGYRNFADPATHLDLIGFRCANFP